MLVGIDTGATTPWKKFSAIQIEPSGVGVDTASLVA